VALFTAFGAVGATVVYGAIHGRSETPDRTFSLVAAVALVLSLIPDIGLIQSDPSVTVGVGVVLMVLHVTTAVACVALLIDRLSPLAD
jgi:divalent metal cation (Fe/Co/Zn/Cd) transporter